MPVQIDESWEYWVPDAECADVLREHNETVVRAAKIATNRSDDDFFFSFAGNNDFETGRFYDGIKFGRMAVPDWFSWNVFERNKRHFEIVGLFEEALADIERQNRTDWLAKNFVSAWNKLPTKLSAILTALLTAEIPERPPGHCGAPKTATGVVADRLGVHRSIINRDYHRARFVFLTECIPDELRPKCACGCGQPAPIAYCNNGVFGHKVGRPVTFISGHNAKKPAKPPSLNGMRLVLPKPPQEEAVPEAVVREPVAKIARCVYCGKRHMATCPKVKSIEYFENGQVKRVELHEKHASASEPPAPGDGGNGRPGPAA